MAGKILLSLIQIAEAVLFLQKLVLFQRGELRRADGGDSVT